MIFLAGLTVTMAAAGIRAFTDCFDLFGHFGLLNNMIIIEKT
jgi:hypothetical protein